MNTVNKMRSDGIETWLNIINDVIAWKRAEKRLKELKEENGVYGVGQRLNNEVANNFEKEYPIFFKYDPGYTQTLHLCLKLAFGKERPDLFEL